MDTKSIVASITCLDFVNKINSLCNDLLYSPNDGYIYTKSVQAINLRDKVLETYSFESNKLLAEFGFSDENDLIQKKKEELQKVIDKHYRLQLPIWAKEVFDELIEHNFFELSINKTKANEIYNSINSAILWLANIKKMPEADILDVKNKYDKKFNQILNSSDDDYIPDMTVKKTNVDTFLNLWDLLLKNYDDFIGYNFDNDKDELSDDDYKYFTYLKNRLITYKKNEILDEVLLIESAVNKLELAKQQKYDFIKAINNDFLCSLEKNKTLQENDKIQLIKRRILLFKDSINNETKYFDKLIFQCDH